MEPYNQYKPRLNDTTINLLVIVGTSADVSRSKAENMELARSVCDEQLGARRVPTTV